MTTTYVSLTKASAARKLNPDDRCRPQLDAALLRMSQLWEAHMERELRSAYPNRRVFLPTFAQFHASLHTQLWGCYVRTLYDCTEHPGFHPVFGCWLHVCSAHEVWISVTEKFSLLAAEF
jgi:hypothetical protein